MAIYNPNIQLTAVSDALADAATRARVAQRSLQTAGQIGAQAAVDGALPQLGGLIDDIGRAQTQMADLESQLEVLRTALITAQNAAQAATQTQVGGPAPNPNASTQKDASGQVYVKAGVVGLIALGAFAVGATGGYVTKGILDKKKRGGAREAAELPAAAAAAAEEEEEEEEEA